MLEGALPPFPAHRLAGRRDLGLGRVRASRSEKAILRRFAAVPGPTGSRRPVQSVLPLPLPPLLRPIKFDPALPSGPRALHPGEDLGGRVDLVVMAAGGESGQFGEGVGEPGRLVGQMDEAVLERPRLGTEAHDLIAVGRMARHMPGTHIIVFPNLSSGNWKAAGHEAFRLLENSARFPRRLGSRGVGGQ
jgi:hypothetical protein